MSVRIDQPGHKQALRQSLHADFGVRRRDFSCLAYRLNPAVRIDEHGSVDDDFVRWVHCDEMVCVKDDGIHKTPFDLRHGLN